MSPDHVLYISLSFEQSRGPSLAVAFKDLGFALETVGTQPRAYKRLRIFEPATWEREVLKELTTIFDRCRPVEIFIEHPDGTLTNGVLSHQKTFKQQRASSID